MSPEFDGKSFDELVGGDDLSAGERKRLEYVHELLVAAGPPPELPAALAEPPRTADLVPDPGKDPLEDNVVPIPARPRRNRRTTVALIAAAVAVAAACFGGGYLLGDNSSQGEVVRVVAMQGVGQQTARASVSLGAAQRGGNWPIEFQVTGLPASGDRDYYELFVTRDGKPSYPCVGFKTHAAGTTTVRFNVPYELKESTKLVVTMIARDKSPWPGRVVMTTA